MDYFQEIIYDMKTVRHLSELNIIFTDESLRDAGRKGTISGDELRKRFADYFYDECKKIGVFNDLDKIKVYRCPLHGFEVVDLKYLSDHEINEPVCTICGHKLVKDD